ncbi:MAG: hypothetical protein JXQ81_04745 [Desulfuromonadales bacterium]|nr:hypothetical protein [Desulfuromonadales bacterium]MBN2791799.1 hypothetical protein [Desulfuromonadales bacterium]
MTSAEIKAALMGLSIEEKKAFIIEALPELAGDVIKEPGFMMQLFPVLLGILKQSGMDLQQLLQLATMMAGQEQQ